MEDEWTTGGTDGSIKFDVILKIINKGNILDPFLWCWTDTKKVLLIIKKSIYNCNVFDPKTLEHNVTLQCII